ncbi:hypothetical protein KCU95_g15281, partial [Aureobasidium melanogenum]
MANNMPRLSLEEQCNRLIQRQFDEVSNERDKAISRLGKAIKRLDKAITIIKKLKDANAGCWHIIANKQLEIDALHAEAALHDNNKQLERTWDEERQKAKDMRAFDSSTASHREQNLRLPHAVTTSIDTSSNAVSILSVPDGGSQRTPIAPLTLEITDLIRGHDARISRLEAQVQATKSAKQNTDAQVQGYDATLIRTHETAIDQATKRSDELVREVNKLKDDMRRLTENHDTVVRQSRKTQDNLKQQISNLGGQLRTVTDQRNHATRQSKALAVQMSALEYHMDTVVEGYEAELQYADYEKSNTQAKMQAEIDQLCLDLLSKDLEHLAAEKKLLKTEQRRVGTKQKLIWLEDQIEYYSRPKRAKYS